MQINKIDQIANVFAQASYVLSSEGEGLTTKDLDAIISKVSRATKALNDLAHENDHASRQKAIKTVKTLF